MGFYSSSTAATINWAETFELFDKNKDGFIDERDLYAILNGLGQEINPEKIQTILKAADHDKDGRINLSEFIEHMKASNDITSLYEERESLRNLFMTLKPNENGFINTNYLRECVVQMGENLSQKEFDDLIEDFDQDHDGFLSFQEFCSLVN